MLRIAILSLVALPLLAGAQTATKIHSQAGSDYYLAGPPDLVRVGSAVMAKIYDFERDYGHLTSSRVLVACDGSWISTMFLHSFDLGNEKDNILARISRLRGNESSLDRVPIEQTSIAASGVPVARALFNRAKSLCASANREPRNFLIPVAASSDKSAEPRTDSIVTGTASRDGSEVDVWIRKTEYKKTARTRLDGTPILRNGSPLYDFEANGNYTLARTAYDCRARRMGFYELSHYKDGADRPESVSSDRTRLKFSSVVPNSVGETLLDWVCQLYR